MQMEACEEARTIAERYGCFLGREMDSYERSALAKLRLIASDSDRAIAEGGTE
jgi:hypothetical protein